MASWILGMAFARLTTMRGGRKSSPQQAYPLMEMGTMQSPNIIVADINFPNTGDRDTLTERAAKSWMANNPGRWVKKAEEIAVVNGISKVRIHHHLYFNKW